MRCCRRLAALGSLVAATLLTAVAAPAAEGGGVRAGALGAARQRPERAWTPARMGEAAPLPLEQAGAPLRAARRKPPPESLAPLGEPGALGYAYPPPYTRFEAFRRTLRALPMRAVGKLFFARGTRDYACTAVSVGNFAVMTAGHCVHAGDGSDDGWSYDVVFVPAYRDGRAPFGIWRAAGLRATEGWYQHGDLRFDLGGAILRRRRGRKISARVGALAPVFNLDVNQHWMKLGYPGTHPFDGRRLVVCAASYAYDDGSFPEGPLPLGIGCDQTAGVSGGPWVLDFGGANRINGITSYRYGLPEELFSPYFGVEASALYESLIAASP